MNGWWMVVFCLVGCKGIPPPKGHYHKLNAFEQLAFDDYIKLKTGDRPQRDYYKIWSHDEGNKVIVTICPDVSDSDLIPNQMDGKAGWGYEETATIDKKTRKVLYRAMPP